MKLTHWAALALSSIVIGACSGGDSPSAPAPAPAADTSGGYDTRLSMAELMAHVIDYSADGIWLNQGWVLTAQGMEELFPTDDAGWMRAESAAITLAETSNLLLLPDRRVDDDAWVQFSKALYEKSMKAHDAAEARDKEAFFNAGGEIYVVCRDCHQRYIIGETR